MQLSQPPSTEPGVYADNSDGGPHIDGPLLDVLATIEASTMTEVGPTGSGSTVIWTALDAVPEGVDWLLVRMLYLHSSTTLVNGLSLFQRSLFGTVSMSAANSPALVLDSVSSPHAFGSLTGSSLAYFNMKGDRRFQLRWAPTGAPLATSKLEVFLVGYGMNGDL